ncbi:unnamed protein product [Prunus brigantina]
MVGTRMKGILSSLWFERNCLHTVCGSNVLTGCIDCLLIFSIKGAPNKYLVASQLPSSNDPHIPGGITR